MSEWVKCSERLPEPHEWVLLFIATVKNGGCIATGCRDIPINDKYDYTVDSSTDWHSRAYRYRDYEITHWQPLPEPPREE